MFSRNPISGKIEAYTGEGEYEGHVLTLFDLIQDKMQAQDGGPGSGNHDHDGRPGLVGGSAPAGGLNEIFNGMKVRVANSISKKAEKHSDSYEKWEGSLTEDERQEIEKQFEKTKSSNEDNHKAETASEYRERIWRMLSANAKETGRVNAPVTGTDLTGSYVWDKKPYTEPTFGQVIDTQIEDIIVKQGFNGVPKIVSKEEMDDFFEKHPEAPIMFRTVSAPDQKTLDKYDSDLESGAWYVDCSVGGSKYGRGMYTAAALPRKKEEMRPLNDPKTYDHLDPGVMIVNKSNGDIYQCGKWEVCTQEAVSKIEPGTLIAATEYSEDYTTVYRKIGNDTYESLENGKKYDSKEFIGYDAILTLSKIPEDNLSSRDVNVPLDQIRGYIKLNEGRESENLKKWSYAPTPKTSTRRMTLDPSSKVITYEDLTDLIEKFDRDRVYKYEDEGSFAAALGYDAIVCSNYGRTIVVLNRTKLILSDERVEVPGEEAS